MRWWSLAAAVLCACGGGGDRAGDAGSEPDARAWPDAAPPPTCDPTPFLPTLWSKQLPDEWNRVAIDDDGTVVVAVGSPPDDPSTCVKIIRYAADGTVLSRHPYDPVPPPAENYRPCPSRWDAIALDPDGSIVTISGDVRYPDALGPSDIILRKHDRDGNALWTYYNQNAPDGFEGADAGLDVAVGDGGVILASGEVGSLPWVGRFTPGGTAEWTRSSTGKAATEVEVSESGIAYAGIMTGDFDIPFRIARFDAGGDETTIDELRRIHARGEDLAGTPDGGVVFVVRGTTPSLRKIDATGAVVWERVMDFTVFDDECRQVDLLKALGTVVAPDGTIDVVLAGSFAEVMARYSADGELISSHRLPSPYDLDDLAAGPGGVIARIFHHSLVVSGFP